MRIFRTKTAAAAIAVCVLGAGIALAQDSPESLLPPGFNEPVAPPAPQPTTAPGPRAPGGLTLAPTTLGRPAAPSAPEAGGDDAPADPAADALLAEAQAAALAQAKARYEAALSARRSLTRVGPAGPAEGALGPDAFRGVNGVFAETLMRRLDAPIASRWLSIALRKTLMSRVDTPADVGGADFAAERAWLLLRMGESVAGRAVAESVDPEHYTPKLYQVMMQAALATGDPGALCPAVNGGAALAGERGWVLAKGMCAGLAAQPSAPIMKALERKGVARGIDMLLARKVAGMGASGRQAITVEWAGVDQLTAWRFGLALATGTAIPETLLGTVAPHVQSWRALSPMLSVRDRIAPADYAAARGVLSSAALVDLYGAIDADDDQSLAEISVARDLRTAYAAGTRAERMTALRGLWDEPKTADGRYARLILTARAAARVPVDTAEADVGRLVGSMLAAGLDRSALRWRERAEQGSDAWAMLLLANPDVAPQMPYRQVSAYSDDALKQRMLFAGLAGLGRLSRDDISRGAEALDVKVGAENGWTRAIDRAARLDQPGLVVLLAAIAMQTSDWRGVPPEALYRIIGAMRAVGLGGQARMIAAEAIARL
ncbi:hypothetical protein [Sphingomonas endolithica]|uniref:hypothetical protein n=1 Tax=Sphingomonas endolithica TaxID=2972485 RepID=UPI0021AF3C8B|nr:hypothetical protein [Sphingomonas sp. ZFBP2030]